MIPINKSPFLCQRVGTEGRECHLFKTKNTILHFFLHIAPNLLLLIFAESAIDFVHSEKIAVGIVPLVQPYCYFKSCAKDMVIYAKRKGANLIGLLLEEAATYSPT